MYDKNSECFELAINLILLENIKVMFNTLKYDYFIFGVADWDLYNCIGYPESYRSAYLCDRLGKKRDYRPLM